MSEIGAVKDDAGERPVPVVWRVVLKRVADALVQGEIPEGDCIRKMDDRAAQISIGNVRSYPDAVGPLQDASWDTSVYIWVGHHWDVLVDLSLTDGSTSDLVLQAIVREAGDLIEIEPYLIYVP